jgi:dipeptidyl-peptidase 4
MIRRGSFLLIVLLFALLGPVAAQDGTANYRLAARWAPYKMQQLVYSTSVNPRWIQGSERFWYEWKTSDGTTYYIVDPVRGTREPLFDNERIAAEITRITRDPYDRQNLPIRSIKFINANTLRFEVESTRDEKVTEEIGEQQDEQLRNSNRRNQRTRKKVHYFEYDVRTRTLRELSEREEPDNHPSWASVSPDGNRIVFARKHDLYMMTGNDYRKILDARRGKRGDDADVAEEKVDVTEIRLTEDGEEHYSYAVSERGSTDEEVRKNADKRKRAAVSWSHDGTRVSMIRSDQRQVGDLWVVHNVGHKRPQLESYKYDMPGETNVTQSELLIFDLPARSVVRVQADGFKDQRLGTFTARQFIYPDSDEPRRSLWLSSDPHEVYFWRRSRDQHRLDVCVADARTGEVRVLIEERLNTYVEHNNLELLRNGEMIWWSERDGWAHLYRFDRNGRLINRLTEGSWSVRGIEGVDRDRGVVYFQANGREAGEDPYYQHLYRVNLDASRIHLLNAGDYDHRVSLGESNRYFVNNFSRVNTIPSSVLYETNGRRILDLGASDFSRLTETGYQFPEPFSVKAADGVTDLYGVMYKPFDFDPSRRYPIVAYVYPGPQTEAVNKSFSTNATEVALAQFGFIVITVGNRGGHPARSKWYHNYGYGNLRDYGLADKKVAIEQLADRHSFVDIDRVGIYGHSGGGFMSTAAMLVYPDFFKVAVSSAGNHNNDIYNQNWSEKHHGIREVVSDTGEVSFLYDIEKNSDLARNLKGHLLLTTGDVDNNVHPAGTIRMGEALIRANKRFDFFMYPGQRHGYGNMSNYWFWQRAEYFVRHLIGDTRWNADITELNNEVEQKTRR